VVDSWVKNDHLGFEILYVHQGVVRKYRPDFLIRLTNEKMLVLEAKGRDTEQDETKRQLLAEWVTAVNSHGGFGSWSWDVSFNPGDLKDILARHHGDEPGRDSTR
jgi:type III restriction enzyme